MVVVSVPISPRRIGISVAGGAPVASCCMSERVVRVLPDVKGIEKTFDYLVPDKLRAHVRVGSLVRIDLNRRRAGGIP